MYPKRCTHPDFRRQGVAENLLMTMMDYAQLAKVSKIFLEVRSDNIPAQKLYEKMGFVENGIRKGYYTTRQGQMDAICMVKEM